MHKDHSLAHQDHSLASIKLKPTPSVIADPGAVVTPSPEDVEVRKGPPKHLSHSGAQMFSQCPLRWKFYYIDRLPDPPGEGAVLGTFAHLVLEHLMQLPPKERTQEKARLIAREKWPKIEADEEYVALGHTSDESRKFRWGAWRAIEGLWAVEDPEAVEVRSTEQEITVELEGVPFRGVVDRIEVESEKVKITDYKSGKAPPERFKEARLDQVILYAAAVEASFGEMPTRAQLIYLGQRVDGVEVTREQIERVTQKLGETAEAIKGACKDESFEAKPGPLCGWCAFIEKCEEGSAEVERRRLAAEAEDARLTALANMWG